MLLLGVLITDFRFWIMDELVHLDTASSGEARADSGRLWGDAVM